MCPESGMPVDGGKHETETRRSGLGLDQKAQYFRRCEAGRPGQGRDAECGGAGALMRRARLSARTLSFPANSSDDGHKELGVVDLHRLMPHRTGAFFVLYPGKKTGGG